MELWLQERIAQQNPTKRGRALSNDLLPNESEQLEDHHDFDLNSFQLQKIT